MKYVLLTTSEGVKVVNVTTDNVPAHVWEEQEECESSTGSPDYCEDGEGTVYVRSTN